MYVQDVLGFVMQSISQTRAGFVISLPHQETEKERDTASNYPSSFSSFVSSLFSSSSTSASESEEKDKVDITPSCRAVWLADGVCDPPCDTPQ